MIDWCSALSAFVTGGLVGAMIGIVVAKIELWIEDRHDRTNRW